MKKQIIETVFEQKKGSSKIQPQQLKVRSAWKTIRKTLLSWAKSDPKL